MLYIPKSRKCPVCGKEFYTPDGEWAYKMGKSPIIYLCSWGCKRIMEKRMERKEGKR